MIHTIIIVAVCLGFSAFFSGMEIAFVAQNRLKAEIEKKRHPMFGRIMGVFSTHPGQYITTILVGNNIALVLYSLNMTILLKAVASYYGWHALEGSIFTDTVIATLIIIFAGEFIPKAVVKVDPNFYMKTFALPVYIFYLLLYPFARFSTMLSGWILRAFGLKLSPGGHMRKFDRIDLTNLVDEATDNEYEGQNEHEIELFRNVLDFSDLRVRDCMVPRVDVEAVEIGADIKELRRRFVDSKYSRIMVYRGSIDNIVGYVNTKSLFTFPETIDRVLIKAQFVPESMLVQRVLADMIKHKQSVAVVIDEFGGTAGIISTEDILEEIFGEIDDEHDEPDMVEKQVGPAEYIFSCRLEVDYLNDKYGLGIPESDDYDTLAGYIIFKYNGIPDKGESLMIDGKQFSILKTTSSKLLITRVKILE